MKHKIWVHFLIILWAICATRVVYAATFTQELWSMDWESLMWGGLAGLLGGALRTIFTLATDNRVVLSIVKESRKDMVVAALAGLGCYVLLAMITSKYPELITREIRVGLVVGAGWSRIWFFKSLNRIIASKLDSFDQKVRDGAAMPDAPSSAVVPLGDK